MSAQPTPEGPYHWDSTGDADFIVGPGNLLGRWPDKLDTEHLNIAFAQGKASSAKEVEVYRKALESALKAFECVKANDKTVYNYKGDGAKNRDGLTLEEGRWATPLEIATDEMKLIQALLTSKPEADKKALEGGEA